MKTTRRYLLWTVCLLLAGCVTLPRLDAPAAGGVATPPGFPPEVRLVTTDIVAFARRSPAFFRRIKEAAGDGPVDILALSGGGSEGAFGAGALIGMTRAGTRPEFQLVTGVSAGALIAPFAFLGPAWDEELEQAFTGSDSRLLGGSIGGRILYGLLHPLGRGKHGALFEMVDHFVTPALVEAVAREAAKGRALIVATTDVDTRETVLWNMGVIAAHGGKSARQLFRDVLVASASVPGIFPPVLIHVRKDGTDYDEMHVDGGVTTSVFIFPMIASMQLGELAPLRDAHLYMVVNGQLAARPVTTRVNTLDVMSGSFAAQLTYRTREAIINSIQMADQLDMDFSLTEIPVDYPVTSFMDFKPDYMGKLFDFSVACAGRHELWITPLQSVYRNTHPLPPDKHGAPQCPGAESP